MKTSTYLKNLRSSKKKEYNYYQERLEQLHTIQRNLRSASEDGEEEINRYISNAQDCLISGIQPDGKTSQVRDQLHHSRDEGISDSNIENAFFQLNAEEKRVSQKIEELKCEISCLNNKITNALTEEKNAQSTQK